MKYEMLFSLLFLPFFGYAALMPLFSRIGPWPQAKNLRYQFISSSNTVVQKILQYDKKRGAHSHTSHPTKSDSLTSYLPFMVISMYKILRYRLIPSRDIDNQRILESDWKRQIPGHNQPKVIF